jgi:hypothetical protein
LIRRLAHLGTPRREHRSFSVVRAFFPRYYDHQRFPASAPDSAIRCNDQYGACGSDDGVTPGAIEAALEDPDLRHALSITPVFYGTDPRPSDGAAFR